MKRSILSSIVVAAIVFSSSAFTPSKPTDSSGEGENEKTTGDAPAKWSIDKAHSNVKFTVTPGSIRSRRKL